MEDNRVSTLVRGTPLRLPFGIEVQAATVEQYPTKQQLLNYFHEARAVTEQRLRDTTDRDFDRIVEEIDFGRLTVREVWTGVVTSFACRENRTDCETRARDPRQDDGVSLLEAASVACPQPAHT